MHCGGKAALAAPLCVTLSCATSFGELVKPSEKRSGCPSALAGGAPSGAAPSPPLRFARSAEGRALSPQAGRGGRPPFAREDGWRRQEGRGLAASQASTSSAFRSGG